MPSTLVCRVFFACCALVLSSRAVEHFFSAFIYAQRFAPGLWPASPISELVFSSGLLAASRGSHFARIRSLMVAVHESAPRLSLPCLSLREDGVFARLLGLWHHHSPFERMVFVLGFLAGGTIILPSGWTCVTLPCRRSLMSYCQIVIPQPHPWSRRFRQVCPAALFELPSDFGIASVLH
jgi:hypothetical protein